MPSVEERLARVEQDVQQLQQAGVDAGLRAQAYGLSLVHAEVAEVKAIQAEIHEEQAAMSADIGAMNNRLERIEGMLTRLLER